jgi:hypothetical protein
MTILIAVPRYMEGSSLAVLRCGHCLPENPAIVNWQLMLSATKRNELTRNNGIVRWRGFPVVLWCQDDQENAPVTDLLMWKP